MPRKEKGRRVKKRKGIETDPNPSQAIDAPIGENRRKKRETGNGSPTQQLRTIHGLYSEPIM